MIIRITSGDSGFSEYIRYGRKTGEPLLRHERDVVIPLFGDLDTFEKVENFEHENCNYKGGNYRHISISFSKEDIAWLDRMPPSQRIDVYQEIIKKILDFYCPGYSQDELVVYSEVHRPRTKINSEGKEKYEHIHLGVNMYSPLLGKQIAFREFNMGTDARFQEYLNRYFGFTDPKTRPRPYVPDPDKIKRPEIAAMFRGVETEEDIFAVCEAIGCTDIRMVETKKNRYVSMKFNGLTYNLRGKDFHDCELVTNPTKAKFVKAEMTMDELTEWVQKATESRTKINLKKKAQGQKKELKELTDETISPKKWRSKADKDIDKVVNAANKLETQQRRERQKFREYKALEAAKMDRELTKQEKGFLFGNVSDIPFDSFKEYAIAQGRWNPDVISEFNPVNKKVKIHSPSTGKTFEVGMAKFVTDPKFCGFTQTETIDKIIPKLCGYRYEPQTIDRSDRSYIYQTMEDGKVQKQLSQDGKKYFAKLNAISPVEFLKYCKDNNLCPPQNQYSIDPDTLKIRCVFPNGKVSLVSNFDFLTKTNHCGLSAQERDKLIEKFYEKELQKQATLEFPMKFSSKVADLFKETATGAIDLCGGYFWNEAGLGVVNDILNYMKKTIYSATKYRPLNQYELDQKRKERLAAKKEKDINDLRNPDALPDESALPKYLQKGSEGEKILTQMGYRDGDHAEEFSNAMIFDIDNAAKDQAKVGKALSMDEAFQKLKASGFAGFTLTTKSFGITKLESVSEKDIPQENRHLFQTTEEFEKAHPDIKIPQDKREGFLHMNNSADRFRLVVCGQESVQFDEKFKDTDKQKSFVRECYRRLREKVANMLGIDQFVDTATNDLARCYKPSGDNAIARINVDEHSKYLDLNKIRQDIEPQVVQDMDKTEREALEDRMFKLPEKIKTQNKEFKPLKKEYLITIDFPKIYSEVKAIDVLEAFNQQYTYRPDKGKMVIDVGDHRFSCLPGKDREMIHDFKTGHDIDVVELMKLFSNKSNIKDVIDDFSSRHTGSILSYTTKNLKPVQDSIDVEIRANGSKSNLQRSIADKFGLRKDQIQIKNDQILVGKHAFTFQEMNLTQQQIQRLNSLPLITQNPMSRQQQPAPQQQPQQATQQQAPKPQQQQPAPAPQQTQSQVSAWGAFLNQGQAAQVAQKTQALLQKRDRLAERGLPRLERLKLIAERKAEHDKKMKPIFAKKAKEKLQKQPQTEQEKQLQKDLKQRGIEI